MRELNDDAIDMEVTSFTGYYRKLFTSTSVPFIEGVFDEWADAKDFTPDDRDAIRADVVALLAPEARKVS